MAVVFLPRQVSHLTGDAERVEVDAGSYRELMAALERRFPGVREAIEKDMAVAIDGEIINEPLLERIEADSEVHFLARISGG